MASVPDRLAYLQRVRWRPMAEADLAYVAAGRTDGFWELGLSQWDFAAGALLIAYRDDRLLGPIFAARITDWPPHLERMVTFWSSVALMTGQYHGRPVPAHTPLPIEAAHFDRWLALFRATAEETCTPAGAAHVMERAERIGAAQARAQVVRVGHAVEHEQQRRLGDGVEHVVERDVGQRGVDDRHDALVPAVAGAFDLGGIYVFNSGAPYVFAPAPNLGLIIVDEEHDSSYKQYDPAPRYHARDAAMMLSRIHGGRTLLGSATPSLESYHNASSGRYGFVELMTRYGDVMMPQMIVADTRSFGKKIKMTSHFTQRLLEAITEALGKEEQVILFQNRRGFSPYLMCPDCGWVPGCTNCSVSYTYHKSIGKMVCHYCGRSTKLPAACPECGSEAMTTRGFGTEKIEEEIRLLFPSARVVRMDQDTTRRRSASSEILSDFAAGATDILIGTQMISKGLDFERLTVVGILDADNMMHYPDFRAFERSFQLMEQVSGRAGRRTRRGKVIIQTADPAHIILRQVMKHDYKAMCTSQLEERSLFGYPPFTKIIRLSVRHRDPEELNVSAARLAESLRRQLGSHVLGPEFPVIMQVQRWYIKTIMIKIDSSLSPSKVKEVVRRAMERELKMTRKGILRIHADVDPQ